MQLYLLSIDIMCKISKSVKKVCDTEKLESLLSSLYMLAPPQWEGKLSQPNST